MVRLLVVSDNSFVMNDRCLVVLNMSLMMVQDRGLMIMLRIMHNMFHILILFLMVIRMQV